MKCYIISQLSSLGTFFFLIALISMMAAAGTMISIFGDYFSRLKLILTVTLIIIAFLFGLSSAMLPNDQEMNNLLHIMRCDMHIIQKERK